MTGATSVSEFSGFPAEGLALLAGLPRRNAAWFKANQKAYRSTVLEPAKAFVTAMGALLAESISPEVAAEPKTNGSIAPINNDVRFAKDKSPYKDHLLFRFWQGRDKKTAPTLFVRLSAESVGFASGAVFASVDEWRKRVDDDKSGATLAKAIQKIERGRSDVDVAGAALKRVPAPYGADHPRAELLKHKLIQIRWPEPVPNTVGSARFAPWCDARLARVADLHRWLVQNL
jgi:uncharacterized protein (TIGR02453 family)